MSRVIGWALQRWIPVIAGGLLLIFLSGCTFISDPKTLMKTPELTSEKESLKSVIEAELKGAPLVRPRNVSDVSAIRVMDLNKDGIMEAVVFYETPEETVRIHGLILEKQGDTWEPKVHFDGEGQVLESFDLKDMTGDGHINIIAGFSSGDSELQKGLNIYSYNGSTVEKLLSLPYNHFVIDDLNNDGAPDITVVTLKKEQYSTVTTYQYSDSFQELDQIQLEDHISEYYNVVHGNVTSKVRGIILDAALGTNDAYSHIIVMKDNKLVDLLDQDFTYKAYPIMSGDVNDDGILEIGRLEIPKGWEYISFDEIPWLFSYYQWDEEKGLKFVMQQYMDLLGRFYFSFPNEWRGNVTIDTEHSDKNEYLRFIRIDNNETLAEIRFFSLSEWERYKSDWELLVRDKDKVIGFLSHTDLKVNKGEKEIKR
ncbi:hypothetical protein [Paenibacillus segetis]|uniref:Repeat domain-containing protein n=1 Tax=Paenibacillus segetis TaxID=1325360 RepID=A0ABQ1YF58_9BACL|nr:hypothetical protein [Paenibacillus segetis]GGH22346.1 hypothetical protein GCM10008013_20760 [Paenibacillus segetis]